MNVEEAGFWLNYCSTPTAPSYCRCLQNQSWNLETSHTPAQSQNGTLGMNFSTTAPRGDLVWK